MKTNHFLKLCVIFLFVTLSSYGKNEKAGKSMPASLSVSKLVNHRAKQASIASVTVNMTASSTLHAVVVGIASSNLTFYSTSNQSFSGYVSGSTYTVTVTTVTQRCHVTLNGQTQDTSGGHGYVTFNNVPCYAYVPIQISVTAF